MHIQVVQEQLLTHWRGGGQAAPLSLQGGSPPSPKRGPKAAPGTPGTAGGSPICLRAVSDGHAPCQPFLVKGRALTAVQHQGRAWT